MKQNNELQHCLLSNFCNLISVRLDNSNYVTWKFLLETMLKGCGLLRYVDGSFPCPPRHMIGEEAGVTSEMAKQYMNWEQNDSAIMSILAATLSSDVLSFVVGSKTSRELWCLLKERYASTSWSNRMHLKTTFQDLQKGSDSIDKYLLRVKIVCDQLANVGVHMSDEDIIVSVLHGLPSEFATMKTIIRTKRSLVSMHELRSLLLIAEDEIQLATKSTSLPSNPAMAAYSDTPRGTIPSHLFTDSSLPSIGTGLVPPTTVCPHVGTSSNATGYKHAFVTLNGRDKDNGVFGHSGFTQRGEQRDIFKSSGCTDFCNGVQRKKTTFDNQIPKAGGTSNSQSVCFPGDVCQICSQFGHIAETCPQRSAPRQVIISGFSFQCQICFNMGHSAAECLHRHHYSFHPKTSEASHKVKFSPECQVSEFCVSEASAQDFEENFKMGFEKESLVSNLVDKKREHSVGSEVSLAGIQKFIQETKSVNEANCKEGFTASLPTVLGKETKCENLVDVKKKQLLEEVATILVPTDTTTIDERIIGDLGLQSGTDATASQLFIPTQPSFMSNSPSMISTASFGISNHKIYVSAAQTSNLSEWQQAMLKEIAALPLQDIWQLSSTPLDNTSLHCRPASRPVVLCQSVPLIPPG